VLFLVVVPGRMRADELALEDDLDRLAGKRDLHASAPTAVAHRIGPSATERPNPPAAPIALATLPVRSNA